tara:strand:- start:711 stop:1019 length:309 start_codon:yes stop_codon:yes gene_type:complete
MRSRNFDQSVNNIFNKQKSAPVASMNSHFSSKNRTMKQNIEAQLLHTIHNLEAALNVCNNADNTSDDDDRSYPFATGYAKSAMTTSVEDLEKVLHYLRAQVS